MMDMLTRHAILPPKSGRMLRGSASRCGKSKQWPRFVGRGGACRTRSDCLGELVLEDFRPDSPSGCSQ